MVEASNEACWQTAKKQTEHQVDKFAFFDEPPKI
jgi:hypothetical protein